MGSLGRRAPFAIGPLPDAPRYAAGMALLPPDGHEFVNKIASGQGVSAERNPRPRALGPQRPNCSIIANREQGDGADRRPKRNDRGYFLADGESAPVTAAGREEFGMSAHPPPQAAHWPEGAIFTLGHSTLPIERFVALLRAYGIERLVDIRTVPRSRHNPQFNDSALAGTLAAEHVEYIPDAGAGRIAACPQGFSQTPAGATPAFAATPTICKRSNSRRRSTGSLQMSRQRRVAIMCAEAVPWRCHRSLVADALAARAVPVIEILSESSYRAHKLTPFAHVDGMRITYPPEQAKLL